MRLLCHILSYSQGCLVPAGLSFEVTTQVPSEVILQPRAARLPLPAGESHNEEYEFEFGSELDYEVESSVGDVA